MCGDVHNALHVVSGLGTASAAVGVGGHLVGEDAYDVNLDGRNLVATSVHERGKLGDQRGEKLMVRAKVREYAGAKAKNRAVLL